MTVEGEADCVLGKMIEILERQRNAHEDIERMEQPVVDRKPKNHAPATMHSQWSTKSL